VTLFDRDPDLRRFERDGLLACGAMVVIALVWQRGRWDGAAGVVGGAALMAMSYRALRGAADLVVALAGRSRAEDEGGPALPAGNRAILGLKFFSRYALLAAGAYAMLRWFCVHPVGLLAGATTPFLAALVQAVRSYRAPSPRDHP
jgi:hypothetical protein